MDIYLYVRMERWMDGWMDGLMYMWSDVCIDGCMDYNSIYYCITKSKINYLDRIIRIIV